MYKGKTVLITGASRGIGYMLADHFNMEEATVIDISRKSCDLAEPKAIEKMFKSLKLFKFDILINNAAVLTSQYAIKMQSEDIEKMIRVNILGSMLVMKHAAKMMRDKGRIVNISSMAVPLEPQGDSVYAATKAAMEKFTNILAKELQIFGITCNTLGISAIDTDMLRQLNKGRVDQVVNGLPVPRYATEDDIVNVIDFFCSPKSDYITAQTIYLGGVHA